MFGTLLSLGGDKALCEALYMENSSNPHKSGLHVACYLGRGLTGERRACNFPKGSQPMKCQKSGGIHTCAFAFKNDPKLPTLQYILLCINPMKLLMFNQFWLTKWQLHMIQPNVSFDPQHIAHLTHSLDLNFLY